MFLRQRLTVTPSIFSANQQTFKYRTGRGHPNSQTTGSRRRKSAIGGRCGKNRNNEYEGESHDVIDNKGSIFLSHDVYDK
jgi:hypothetical protein